MIDVQLLALVGASALLPEVAIPSELHALDSASIDAAWADIADIVLIPLQEWNAMSSVDFQSFAAIAIPGCGQSRLIDREVSGSSLSIPLSRHLPALSHDLQRLNLHWLSYTTLYLIRTYHLYCAK